MTTPVSGPISFSQINAELGRDPNSTLNMNDGDLRTLAWVGTGANRTVNSTLVMSDLRNKARTFVTVGSNQINYNY